MGLRVLISVLLVAGTALPAQPPSRVSYPDTRTVPHEDQYHGRAIADPFRWLEDGNAADTKRWIEAQNAVTRTYLDALPMRAHFVRRITELWNYPRIGVPFREAGRLWYRRNSGLQRQSPLYSRASLGDSARLVLDPNELSPDGSLALTVTVPSPDGRYLAVGLSEGGSDWRTVHIRDLASGAVLSDTVRFIKFSGVVWTKDGRGFFYSRYPEPAAGEKLQGSIANQKLYYHRVGTPQSSDILIYERPDQPTWFIWGSLTEDGRYLLIALARGSDPRNQLFYADLGDPRAPDVRAPIRPLFESWDASYNPVANRGSTIYMLTDRDAPRQKIVAFDLARPESWRTIVPEGPHAIEQVTALRDRLVVNALQDVQARVRFFGYDGRPMGALALPGIGTVAALSAREDGDELFYAYTSPLYPTTVFQWNAQTGRSTPFDPPRTSFDPSNYETVQRFATSRDGTRVPLFITMRKGTPRDGRDPTMLYAYGGFNVSITPGYASDVPAWLEQGGIYVTANLRGGGEYGEEWHKAGMFERKQNVFDDFIAVAEFLVREQYTSPRHLGISGASNGGLLVGAVMNQRPDLFAAAFPAVGVMDMLRYHRFTVGAAWATEYGSADDPRQFEYLVKYSPLHNLRPGTCYPATLVTTADHDDRVVPGHSFKYTAALQAAQGCEHPALIRIETQGSHGYLPTDKRIAELADKWAFAAHHLGMTLRPRSM
jgi:prolyl oligopeptidase